MHHRLVPICACSIRTPLWRICMKRVVRSLPSLLLSLGYCLARLDGNLAADEKKNASPETKARAPVTLTEEALRIHRDALLIDGHNDLPWQFREKRDLSFR